MVGAMNDNDAPECRKSSSRRTKIALGIIAASLICMLVLNWITMKHAEQLDDVILELKELEQNPPLNLLPDSDQ